jgi:hypothetical protein
MKGIAQNKIARKLVLLALLAGTLAYLRAPSKVYGETCLQECEAALQACGAACHGVGTCIGECFDLYVACEKRCE